MKTQSLCVKHRVNHNTLKAHILTKFSIFQVPIASLILDNISRGMDESKTALSDPEDDFLFLFTFCSIGTLTIQCCNVGGAGAGPFWAVQWWWWCWSGSLCRAGAGLLTFLEHPIMCPPLLEDLAKWFSWMMAYCSLQVCDSRWFKFQNCCKITTRKGRSTLNIRWK